MGVALSAAVKCLIFNVVPLIDWVLGAGGLYERIVITLRRQRIERTAPLLNLALSNHRTGRNQKRIMRAPLLTFQLNFSHASNCSSLALYMYI